MRDFNYVDDCVQALMIAADDGVKQQTVEAIKQIQAANVPIIVAINKIDKPQANLDMVKKQLSEAGLVAEDWGGKTITVAVDCLSVERGAKIKYCEAFEDSGYGAKLTKENLTYYFPFLKNQ